MRYFIAVMIILSAVICTAGSVDDLLRQGKYYQAQEKLSDTYGRDAESVEYLFLQGRTKLSGESSAAHLKDYINKSSEDTYVPDWARLLLGKYYMSQGLFVTARKQFGTIPIGSPFYNEAEYLAARCYQLSAEYEDAILAYGEITAQSHHNDFREWAFLGTGDAYYEMGDYRKAEECYSELFKSTQDDNVYALALVGMIDLSRATDNNREAAYYYDIYESRYGSGMSLTPIIKEQKQDMKQPESGVKIEKPSTSSGVRYYIQVGAFSKKDNALHLADLYRESGYKVYMETFVENNKEFYRILVGGYNSKQQAEFIQRRLENAAGEKYLLITR